jgi:hypothetical protein
MYAAKVRFVSAPNSVDVELFIPLSGTLFKVLEWLLWI